jgi:hypothetical protein
MTPEEEIVGRWLQREPATDAPVSWTFNADGSFSAPGTPFAKRATWCVHRHVDDPAKTSVWLFDASSISHNYVAVVGVSATELRLEPHPHRIRRTFVSSAVTPTRE